MKGVGRLATAIEDSLQDLAPGTTVTLAVIPRIKLPEGAGPVVTARVAQRLARMGWNVHQDGRTFTAPSATRTT